MDVGVGGGGIDKKKKKEFMGMENSVVIVRVGGGNEVGVLGGEKGSRVEVEEGINGDE